MPLFDAKYRVKTTKKGKKIRLAFRKGKVIEAKNLDTGAVHTENEFMHDSEREKGKRMKSKAFG